MSALAIFPLVAILWLLICLHFKVEMRDPGVGQ